ncbi:MAG: TauD/TfdA family dioxygenase, partial [Pyrinomonadaceae bacterium]
MTEADGAGQRPPGAARRRAVSLSPGGLVRTELLGDAQPLPLVVRPNVKGVDLQSWTSANRALIEEWLLRHGGILFRGFAVRTADEFQQFASAACGGLLEYNERSSPRTQVGERIYSSTDYDAAHSIFLHNENSYQSSWPLKIIFFCETPSTTGGETPIADCRRVFARIPASVRERFAEKGWMYVRNFGDGLGLDWRTVFQTTERAVVEEHCRRHGIEFEWKDGGRLRTRSVRPAVARHPRTSELVWFNHATFFHVTTLEPPVRELLMREFDERDLPTNTFYGDGSPIEESVADELREAYRQETVVFPWQRG